MAILEPMPDGFERIVDQIIGMERPHAVPRFDDIFFATSQLE